MALFTGFGPIATADSLSDTFQPDIFGTNSALAHRTPGLSEPPGPDLECAVTVPLSFPAAVNLALCRNPTTRAAWATAHEQAAALGAAESAWLPQVGVTGTAQRDIGQHVDALGQLESSSENVADAAVTMSWTLYDFGARTGRIRAARSLLDAAAANLDSVVQQTVLAVVQAYYGVIAADGLLDAAKTNETVAAHSLELAHTLRTGGAGTLADELQAATAHDQAVIARVQAEAAAQSARGTLAVTLGLDADRTLRLNAAPLPDQVPAFSARMADLMAEAVRQRPDLKVAQAQRDAAEANITVARAAGRPSIGITAGHTFVYSQGIPNQNYSQIGVSVTVPIFTGFSVGYGVRQAQAALAVSEANLEQARLAVTAGVWNAYYALDSAGRQLTETASLISNAENNQQVAVGRYQAGVGTIVDVLTAQSAAALARQTRVNAELGWRVARAQLALALGRLASAEPLSNSAQLP
ncbi:MAG: TolC family protein [Steroidobacteraceae bacterium]